MRAPAPLLKAAFVAAAALAFLAAPAAASAEPASAAPRAVEAAPAAPVTAVGGVEDFSFDSFTADYTLGRTGDNRSALSVVEKLVAVFPEVDQNRGIIRAIPTLYDGHDTHIDVKSVTDADGKPRPFAMGTDGSFTTITIAVPEGQYVHGTQTYVITYSQLDVTKFFKNTNDDEFYWDTNGTGWRQPFGTVTAHIHLDAALRSALTGKTACYFGYEGETGACTLKSTDDGFSASMEHVTPTRT